MRILKFMIKKVLKIIGREFTDENMAFAHPYFYVLCTNDTIIQKIKPASRTFIGIFY